MDIGNFKELLSETDVDIKQQILARPCPLSIASFDGQTLGQYLFKLASDITDEQHTQKNGMSLQEFMQEHNLQRDNILKTVVGDDFFAQYMRDLQTLRDKRAAEIMQNTPHLYHFSQITPEDIGQYLTPKPQISGNALNENIDEALCYAASSDKSPYILKSPSDENLWNGFTCDTEEQIVMINGQNPEEFLQQQQLSYCYEVDKSSFKPNIRLDGQFTNEYESGKPAKIIGIKGPFSVVDMCSSQQENGWDIPLYFCPNRDDKGFIKQKINELRGIGSTRKDALKQISRQYPDKLIYFNEDKALTDYAKSLPIEQKKLKEKDKVAQLNKELMRQRQAKKSMNDAANLIMVKRGFQNPKNRQAVLKKAQQKERKTGQTLTEKEIKIAKIKAAGKGK